MTLFMVVTVLLFALTSWGFASASVSAYTSGHKKTGLLFAFVSVALGVGGILIWLFL